MLAGDRDTVKMIHKGILLPQWAKMEDEDLSWLDKGTMAAEDVARGCSQDGMPFSDDDEAISYETDALVYGASCR